MDYIDYELNKYYEREAYYDKMNELGFNNEDEYIDYLADLKEEAQIAHWDAIQER